MANHFILAAISAAILAAPAASETVRVNADTFVTRMPYQELKTPKGRADMLASLQASAARLCDGVHPRRDAEACARDVVKNAERTSIPQVARAIRLAQTEQVGIAYAAQ